MLLFLSSLLVNKIDIEDFNVNSPALLRSIAISPQTVETAIQRYYEREFKLFSDSSSVVGSTLLRLLFFSKAVTPKDGKPENLICRGMPKRM